MSKPFCVSIIICTCNRAEHLRRTLDSMGQICVPGALTTELIVVDNASTDNTEEVVKACFLPGIEVRYLHEPVQGQCHARNAGIAAAKGQIFLFTDDDVRPPKNWIEGMCRPILTGEMEAVAGGVRFAPHLNREWMQPKHRSVLASTERLDPHSPEDMIGANMAFSRQVLEKVPQFDTDLGPGALGFIDDTLFSFQLKEAGYRIGAALDIEVEHHFQEERLLRTSFLQTAKKMGRSSAYLAYHLSQNEPKYLLLHLLKLKMELIYWEAKYRGRTQSVEGISLKELMLVTLIHFYKYLHSERKKNRYYPKHGLLKYVTQ